MEEDDWCTPYSNLSLLNVVEISASHRICKVDSDINKKNLLIFIDEI